MSLLLLFGSPAATVNVRQFDGVDDQIVLGGGAIGAIGNGAHSWVMLAKPTTMPPAGLEAYASAQVGGTNLSVVYSDNTAEAIALGGDGGDSEADANLTTDWQVLGVDKASGTVAARLHRKVLGSGVWTHVNGTGTVANVAGTCSRIEIGSFQNTSFRDFRVGVIALFNTQLADSVYEDIETNATSAYLASLGPVALWDFNQANVADDVLDLSGGGANETAIVGTTVVTDSVAWTFGASPVYQKTGALIAGTLTRATDAYEATETGSIRAGTRISGADVYEATEVGSLRAGTRTSAADVVEYTEAGSIRAGTRVSASDVFEATESGSLTAGTRVSGADAITYDRLGRVIAGTSLTGADVAESSRTGSIRAGTRVEGPDSVESSTTGALIAGTFQTGVAQAGFVSKTGFLAAGTRTSGADAFTATESGALVTQTLFVGEQEFVYGGDPPPVTHPPLGGVFDETRTNGTVAEVTRNGTVVAKPRDGVVVTYVRGGVVVAKVRSGTVVDNPRNGAPRAVVRDGVHDESLTGGEVL